MYFDGGNLVPIMVFMIPIVAVAGGITAGIVKTLSRHRLIELAQRERIAAIERGIDPTKLPPLPAVMGDDDTGPVYMSIRQATQQRARGLLVGGIVTLSVGVGLAAMLYFLVDGEDNGRVWAVGLIPALVGVALLISSWLYSGFAASDPAEPPAPPQAR
jgi:hypothetical protein